MPAARALGTEVLAGLNYHSPLEGESVRQGRTLRRTVGGDGIGKIVTWELPPAVEPVGGDAVSPTFCGGIAFLDGCSLFAAFAAGLEQNRYDPGLPPGAILSRSYAAL